MAASRLSTAPYPVLKRSAVATGVVFALSGMLLTTWVSRIPEVRNQVQADHRSLGFALLCAGVGSILAAPLTGRLLRRADSRAIIASTCVLCGVALLGLGLVRSVVALGCVLIAFGFGYGSWNVAMNVHGHGVESHAGRPWMPRYHAAWSVGGFLGAGLGSLAARTHPSVAAHFGLIALFCTTGVLVSLVYFLADNASGDTADSESKPDGVRRVRLLRKRLVLLGLLLSCTSLIQGAASDWLAIYFVDIRHVAPAAGAAAFTTYAVAMAVSRAAGTWTIEWLSRSGAVRSSGFVALVGLAVLLLSPYVWGAYVGAALWGMGAAIVYPAVVSAAGDTPGRSAEAISLVTPMGNIGFLLGPPVIGVLAGSVGLENALWLVGLLGGVVAVLAGVTRERRVS